MKPRKTKKNTNQFKSFNPIDLSYFKPLQVKVTGPRAEDAIRIFKSLVQKEKVLSLYKEKQYYEKPSVKKRRKSREAEERRLSLENKKRLIESGEWEKIVKKKQAKKNKKMEGGEK